jgi:hypothetical protein
VATDIRKVDVFRVIDPLGPVFTLTELIHEIARKVDDLRVGQAQSASTTTLVDLNAGGANDDYTGWELYIYAGTGRGQTRKVLDYVASTGTFTVSTWATTPDSTSKYELHHDWTREEYKSAINTVIAEVGHDALISMVDETLTQVTNTYEYTIPAGFHYLAQVWSKDSSSGASWKELSFPKKEWSVIPGARKLRVSQATSGSRFRLVGQTLPEALYRDGSFCDVQGDYVIYRAAADLLVQKSSSPQMESDAKAQRANYYAQAASASRPTVKPLNGSRRLF